MSFRARHGLGLLLLASTVVAACEDSSNDSTPGPTVGPYDAGPSSPLDGSNGDGAADGGGDGGDGGPAVVATFTQPPAGLALANGTLFVTLSNTSGDNGLVVSLPTGAAGASVDAGATVLASGLRSPTTVTAVGGNVYWQGIEVDFPNHAGVFAVPSAGGASQEVIPAATVRTRFAIAGGVLYLTDENYASVLSWPLGVPAAATTNVLSISNVFGVDTDGTRVFFLEDPSPSGATYGLLSVAVGGGATTTLVSTAAGGAASSAYVVDDPDKVYWTDPAQVGTIYVAPKSATDAAGTLLATVSGQAPQLLLDGANLYALTLSQLVRVPKAGGAPTVLASVSGAGSDRYVTSGSNATAIAVDDAFVYWLHEGNGQVLRLPK